MGSRLLSGIVVPLFLFFFLFSLSIAPSAGEAQEKSLCGVKVRSGRCYQQLRPLLRMCRKNQSICGVPPRSGRIPPPGGIRGACVRAWKSEQRGELYRFCGLRQYNSPSTYCGQRGMKVALACVQKYLDSAAAAVGSKPKPNKPKSKPKPKPATPGKAEKRSSGEKPIVGSGSMAPGKAKPEKSGSKAVAKERRTGSERAPVAASGESSGGNGWLYFLNLVLLGVLIYGLFFHDKKSPFQRAPEAPSPWSFSPEQEGTDVLTVAVFKEEMERHIEDLGRASAVPQPSVEPEPGESDPGGELRSYYFGLANKLTERYVDLNPSVWHRRVMGTREKLEWLLESNREPKGLGASSTVEMKAVIKSLADILLEMGYEEPQEKVRRTLFAGEFSFADFLERRQEDQATVIANDEELKPFSDLQGEYLELLERLYQSNMKTLMEELRQPMPEEAVQQSIYERRYLREFLLGRFFDAVSRLEEASLPQQTGALVQGLKQFLEEELRENDLELYDTSRAKPGETLEQDPDFFPGGGERRLSRQGIRRRSNPSSIIRIPNSALPSSAPPESNPSPADDERTVESDVRPSGEEIKAVEEDPHAVGEMQVGPAGKRQVHTVEYASVEESEEDGE